MTKDQNGKPVTTHIEKEPDGTWGRNVWWGSGCATTVRRYYYSTRRAARRGDISDTPGTHGRVR